MSAAHALMHALHAALRADVGVGAILGDRIHDRVPERTTFPYATYGALSSRELDAEALEEHALTVEVWSRLRGRSEALLAAEAIRLALARDGIVMDGHRLVSLRMQEVAAPKGSSRGDAERVVLALRAVTEPED